MNNKVSSFTPSILNREAQERFAEIDDLISSTSSADKADLIKKGLAITPLKNLRNKKVDITEIVDSSFFLRRDQGDTFNDLEMLSDPEPIKVVIAEGVDGYFIVDGQRRFDLAKKGNDQKVSVQIVGKVVCLAQIALARGKEMVKFSKPLTPLELTQGLMQLRESIDKDFGIENFFSHGGNRRGHEEGKKSLSDYIARQIGIRKTTVRTLIQFGRRVGPEGLAGLHEYPDIKDISVRVINQINAGLKDCGLSDKISELLKTMSDERVTEQQLIEAAGEMAHEILADNIRELKANNDQAATQQDDDEGPETVETEFVTPVSPSESEGAEDNPDDSGNKASGKASPFDRSEIQKAMQDFDKRYKSFINYWADIDDFDAIEISKFDDKLAKLNKAWEKFTKHIFKFKQHERK
jgi:hypothetical protein